MHANSHAASCIDARANKMNAIALPGFNDLARSLIPIFHLMDHFHCPFSTLSEKMRKFCRLEVQLTSLQKAQSNSDLLSSVRLSMWRFQMPIEGLSFVKTLATFGVIYTTDPLLQNTHHQDRLPPLTHL